MHRTMTKLRTSARLFISRVIAAPPDAIFRAWTQPEQMRRWMFLSPTNRIEMVVADLRVGGHFSIVVRNGDDVIDHYGEYQQLEWPHRLVFTLEVPKHFLGMTQVSVAIESRHDGSLMRFEQLGVDPSVTSGPWQAMFDTLAKILEERESQKGSGHG